MDGEDYGCNSFLCPARAGAADRGVCRADQLLFRAAGRRICLLSRLSHARAALLPDDRRRRAAAGGPLCASGAHAVRKSRERARDRAAARAAQLLRGDADHERRGAPNLRAVRGGRARHGRPDAGSHSHRGAADRGGESRQHADARRQSAEPLSLFLLQL